MTAITLQPKRDRLYSHYFLTQRVPIMFTLISQPTRNAARITTRNLRKAGKVASVIDNGKEFTGNARWCVSVEVSKVTTGKRKPLTVRPTRAAHKRNNKGFDIRPVTTGINCFDVYLDGVFMLRRDTKIAAYEATVIAARKAGVNYSTLSYR